MYRADSACDVFFDIFNQVGKINFSPTDEAKKAALDQLMNQIIPNSFKFLENRLSKLNIKYVSADNLCYADFCWASFMVTVALNSNFPFSGGIQQQMAMYPKTKQYLERMKEVVAPYVAVRLPRPF